MQQQPYLRKNTITRCLMTVISVSFILLRSRNSATALLQNARLPQQRRRHSRRRYFASLAPESSSSSSSSSSSLMDPLSSPLIYPKSLSPSSITTFQSCPQSFLFQYLLQLPQPPSLALIKGRVTHSVLEQLFDLPARDRTLEHAHNLFRKEWSQIRQDHLDLFTEGMTEREWGLQGLKLLENYMQVENPMQMQPPAQREVWVQAKLTMNDADDEEDPILVRGIVDRLDLVRTATSTASPRNGPSSVSFAITDYKTGKAPELKYSAACNQRIRQEAFFQLQIYAMLLQEMRNNKKKKSSDSAAAMESLPVTQLRLLYLTSVSGQAVSWEDAVPDLLEVKEQVLGVWKEMRQMIDAQDPTVFHGCNRSFCYCHKCRDLFVPGSVWEPKR